MGEEKERGRFWRPQGGETPGRHIGKKTFETDRGTTILNCKNHGSVAGAGVGGGAGAGISIRS